MKKRKKGRGKDGDHGVHFIFLQLKMMCIVSSLKFVFITI